MSVCVSACVCVASAIAANRWYHNDIIAHWGYVLGGSEQEEEIRRRHQMSCLSINPKRGTKEEEEKRGGRKKKNPESSSKHLAAVCPIKRQPAFHLACSAATNVSAPS